MEADGFGEFVAYDAATDTSIVRCRPITGRTHQLRVHLSMLGFPIVSDTMYGGGDPTLSANESTGASTGALVQQLMEKLNDHAFLHRHGITSSQ